MFLVKKDRLKNEEPIKELSDSDSSKRNFSLDLTTKLPFKKKTYSEVKQTNLRRKCLEPTLYRYFMPYII